LFGAVNGPYRTEQFLESFFQRKHGYGERAAVAAKRFRPRIATLKFRLSLAFGYKKVGASVVDPETPPPLMELFRFQPWGLTLRALSRRKEHN
jgi:hypothetical protein